MSARVNHIHQKRHRLRKLRGETAYVDATPLRLHVEELIAADWSLNSIAGVAGVSATTLSRIQRAQQTKARPDIIAKVLAVKATRLADRTNRDGGEPFVSRVGTVRRIQALHFMGWTAAAMREHCGLNTANLIHQQGHWVTRSTHDAIAAMYRELANTPGPSRRTANRARKSGYLGPLAWDNIDRDPEPFAGLGDDEDESGIDPVVVERLLLGDRVKSTRAEKTEAMRQWLSWGRSEASLCAIHGWKDGRYVTRQEGAA